MTVTGPTLHQGLFRLSARIRAEQQRADDRLSRIVQLTIERDAYKRALSEARPDMAERIAREFEQEHL